MTHPTIGVAIGEAQSLALHGQFAALGTGSRSIDSLSIVGGHDARVVDVVVDAINHTHD